jgi:hypothetical protein
MGLSGDFLCVLQRAVSVRAIGPSSLRNQGTPGVLDAVREFLSGLDLSRFSGRTKSDFLGYLDRTTGRLVRAMPLKARNWGAARKGINLFLRDALYNQFLASTYSLQKIEHWLEIPLDGAVARGLKRSGRRGELPNWPGLKKLTPPISAEFQVFAEELANTRGLARVHLDIYLWLEER